MDTAKLLALHRLGLLAPLPGARRRRRWTAPAGEPAADAPPVPNSRGAAAPPMPMGSAAATDIPGPTRVGVGGGWRVVSATGRTVAAARVVR